MTKKVNLKGKVLFSGIWMNLVFFPFGVLMKIG